MTSLSLTKDDCLHGESSQDKITLRKQLFVVASELDKQDYEASAAHGLRWTRGSRGGSLTGALHSMSASASSAKKKKNLAQEEFHDEEYPNCLADCLEPASVPYKRTVK